MNIKEFLSMAASQIVSSSARLDAELLLAEALQRDRTYLYTWPDRVLTEEQEKCASSLLERRVNGEPIAYILGRQEFWSLELSVNSSTLIPRPETECLVEWVLEHVEHPRLAELRILDLGTGTGAVALALASELPNSRITALESNPQALALAEQNRQKHRLSNVECQRSHWYSAIEGQRFHFIVSNPPYIDSEDHHLREGDVRFEPRSALVAADRGLADLQYIIRRAPEFLENEGWIVLEHGYNQGEPVQELLSGAGLQDVVTRGDYARVPRLSAGCHRLKS